MYHKEAFTNNGIFRPVIVVNGQVEGIWKRTVTKNKVLFESRFFNPATSDVLKLTEEAVSKLGKFLGKPVEWI